MRMKLVGNPTETDRRAFLQTAAGLAGLTTAGRFLKGWPLSALVEDGADASTTRPVELRSGKVQGRTINGVHTFLGMPYGAPTAGTRRFLTPLPEPSWTGIRETFEYGHYAPQSGRQRGTKQLQFFAALRAPSTLTPSEDCLYLNVWTKGLGDGGKRPVMVWLHGGGYDQGSGGSLGYAGEGLAQHHDVVAVTINHRLNVLGYSYLGDILGEEFAASANAGQQDLVAALRWVREHAEAFGGDPDRVMIYGQSGGAGKVVTAMAMPDAKGLFHAAAVQSGGSRGGDKEQATESALRLLKELGIDSANARDLQKVPLEQLMEIGAGGDRAFRWGPVIDGQVLPQDPNTSDVSKHIPVIQGMTRTERTVYQIDDPGYGQLTEKQLLANVTELVGEEHAQDIVARYRKENPGAETFALDYYIQGDVRDPGSMAMRRNAQGSAPTWVYRWDWETPVMNLLAPHTMEIPFVMSHIEACSSMTGPADEQMGQLEAQVAGAWTSLARSGDPNHEGLPQWPAYTDGDKAVMLLDAPCRVARDPGAALREVLA